MSRATVRAAIVNWFSPPNVAGLNTIYSAQPKIIQGQDAFSGIGAGSGAVAFPYIEEKREWRYTLGPNGQKLVAYNIGLVVLFRSVKPRAEDAVADHDALMDALETRLRQDSTFGGQVYLAGEGAALGEPDLETVSDLPKQVNQGIHIWSVLKFSVAESLTLAQP